MNIVLFKQHFSNYTAKDIQVSLEDDVITITAENSIAGSYTFKRNINIDCIDLHSMVSSFQDDVLTVTCDEKAKENFGKIIIPIREK